MLLTQHLSEVSTCVYHQLLVSFLLEAMGYLRSEVLQPTMVIVFMWASLSGYLLPSVDF